MLDYLDVLPNVLIVIGVGSIAWVILILEILISRLVVLNMFESMTLFSELTNRMTRMSLHV